ncbi:TPM domain-containing protein [Pseudomonas sp. EL_65y_Pfl2_R96]|uniref:TPM domain-containing protein n=1 Tax=Pseudomonas sp. EL_65y_Pfl2_R96 TaxID=3088699 RepID=UPI0030DB9139
MRVFRIGLALLLCAMALTAQAELTFPALTARVVDNARLIEPGVREQLMQQLQAHEKATGEQVVVVTVENLQGASIEDFGYQLGRHWGIGQKDKNTGALLIVARDDRKLRIEVGYGLEDRLTDAQSSVIINQVITPSFKTGNFSKGISDGVAAMLVVLGGNPLNVGPPEDEESFSQIFANGVGMLFIMALPFLITYWFLNMLGVVGSRGRSSSDDIFYGSGSDGGSGSGSGDGGGGFSGGGGGFGGGGSSGGW